MSKADPYHDMKVYHMADKIRGDGAVKALCFQGNKPTNLRVDSWTMRPHQVTGESPGLDTRLPNRGVYPFLHPIDKAITNDYPASRNGGGGGICTHMPSQAAVLKTAVPSVPPHPHQPGAGQEASASCRLCLGSAIALRCFPKDGKSRCSRA